MTLVVVAIGTTRCLVVGSEGGIQLSAVSGTKSPAARTIAEENALPGATDWTIDRPSLAGEIQAYAGQVSVQPGEAVDLYVSTRTNGAKYNADVYRMGWYGGAGARKLASFKSLDGSDQGRWDPLHGLQGCKTCRLDATTLLIEANWKRSMSIKTGSDWVSGYYLVRFHELATDTSTYAVFIVRDDQSTAPTLVQASTNTWQAYNTWGDASLYGSFGADRKYVPKTRRAYRVSYDRPYDPTINDSKAYGAGLFFSWEYNFVRWAESRGYQMAYTTNVDVSLHPETLRRHRLFISLGHDEYWTKEQRDAVEGARDRGVNLAFLSGNEVYWQARLEASSAGGSGRVLTAYKDAKLDPLARSDPGRATVLFADPPVGRPQSMLSGLAYGSNATPDYQPWRPANVDESWVFRGTGIKAGDAFPGIVGYEYDRMAPTRMQPSGLTMVGNSPVTGFRGKDASASALYVAPSGATVFAAGTVAWSWGLDDWGHETKGRFADDRLRRLTANVIDRLVGAATTATPAATP